MTMPYLHDVFAAAVHYGCRVDWIRLVNNMADHGVQPTVTSLQYRLWELAGKGQRGETWKPWRCDKYVGWTTGQWSIGWHGLDYMVEVRSEPAHQAWIDYAKSFSRCTRLDVAYDLAIDVNGDCLADVMKYWFHKSKVYRRRSNLDPIDYEHREGDGKTWGLGKRSSSAFFRVYNKSAEQDWPILPEVGTIWRIELECKRGRAQFFHDKAKTFDGPYLAAKTALYTYLKSFMFCADDLAWGTVRDLPYKRKEKRNVEKTLKWLERSVRPAIDKLIEAGYAPEVLGNLDLLEVMDQGGPIYGETGRISEHVVSHEGIGAVAGEIWATGPIGASSPWCWGCDTACIECGGCGEGS